MANTMVSTANRLKPEDSRRVIVRAVNHGHTSVTAVTPSARRSGPRLPLTMEVTCVRRPPVSLDQRECADGDVTAASTWVWNRLPAEGDVISA